jgi:hypothetical protein
MLWLVGEANHFVRTPTVYRPVVEHEDKNRRLGD